MKDKEREEKGFKVRDRRRFTEEGELREGVEEESRAEDGGKTDASKVDNSGEGDNTIPPLPPVDFSTFVSSLATSTLYHFGDIPDPQTNKRKKNLPLAKHTIDTIAMLKEKTKGNLTEEETRLIDEFLYNLRMRYIKEVGS